MFKKVNAKSGIQICPSQSLNVSTRVFGWPDTNTIGKGERSVGVGLPLLFETEVNG